MTGPLTPARGSCISSYSPTFDPPESVSLRDAVQRLHRMGGQRLVRDMSAIFIDDVPLRLAAARAALASNDRQGVQHATHSLKSSCAQFGAATMQRLCAAAEQFAAQGSLERVPGLLDALDVEFRGVRSWIEREIDHTPDA